MSLSLLQMFWFSVFYAIWFSALLNVRKSTLKRMLLAVVCKRMQELYNFASKLGAQAHNFARILATGISIVSLTTTSLLFGVGAHFFCCRFLVIISSSRSTCSAIIMIILLSKFSMKYKKTHTCTLRKKTRSYASPWRPHILHVCGPSNVLETDATFFCYTSDVTE